MAPHVTTDHKWKYFRYHTEVPQRVTRVDYDHLSEAQRFDGWIWYRRRWYHLTDFTSLEPHSVLNWLPECKANEGRWECYFADSMSTGVVIQISDDCEAYRIGTYFS